MTKLDMVSRENLIKKLCQQYPFVECGTIGKSLCNRDIKYLKFGSNNKPVLFAAAFHGSEWLTSLLVLLFAEHIGNLISNDSTVDGINIKNFLNKNGLIIVPCVNPDGVEISINGANGAGIYRSSVIDIMKERDTTFWQANARGVDLNHNFDAGWDALHALEKEKNIIRPSYTRYGGLLPESEPETKALVQFCNQIEFRHVIAFHSQGEEIYWNFGKKIPPKAKTMGEKMAKLSGYKLSTPEGLAIGGGFKDWFIQKFNRPGFTIEIGKGKNPLPLEAISSIYDQLEKMLLYCVLS